MNNVYKKLTIIGSLLILMVLALPLSAQQTKRGITQVSGNLYRFQNNFHYSVFLVTNEGIITTDPVNKDAATWLKAELKKRFNQPVKYLVYSHDHIDHIAGGEVFADTALVVAHENTKAAIIGEKRPTAIPDITFSDQMTIELGGETVNLMYLGRSHSDNMIVMHFPKERALFTVDFISVKRVGFRTLSDSYFPDWINAIKAVGRIDFDTLLPGHGPMGSKQDAIDHGQYLEDLYNAVLQAARQGQSLDQMKQTIKLEKYQGWGQYKAWFPMNIEGVYNRIQLQRRGN